MNQPPARSIVLSLCVAAALLATSEAHACPDCSTSALVWDEIRAHSPASTLAILTLAFGVVGFLIALCSRAVHHSRLLFSGTLLLGAGLGGFLDGIVLHQILQWHAMLSSVVTPVDLVSSKLNMFWDGVFHLYAWLATVIATAIVVRETPKAPASVRHKVIGGGALAGWGMFNLVEGLLDHHIYGLHHVHPGRNELAWDVAFLAFGVVLMGLGFGLSVPPLRHAANSVSRPSNG